MTSVIAMAVLVALPALGAAQTPAEPPELAEARRLFEALEYEQAVLALDRAIALLEPLAAQQPARRGQLAGAYEMRARARFGVGDETGASSDFRTLLAVDPGYALSGQVSPRIVALFDETRKTSLGTVVLVVQPEDAAVEINGQTAVVGASGVSLRPGDHVVRASRMGFRNGEERVTLAAGETKQVSLALERTSAVVTLVTAPPDTEVLVNGTVRGKTTAGPLPEGWAASVAALNLAPEAVSRPFVIGDLPVGSYSFRFRKECFAAEERVLTIDELRDYRVDPVQLQSAVAAVTIESRPPGANVHLDGRTVGTTPLTVPDVCEGARTIEVRGPLGRFVERIQAKAGQPMTVKGVVRPAFVLLPSGVPSSADLRATVEKLLAPSQRVTFFAPSGPQVTDVILKERPPERWLTAEAAAPNAEGAARRKDVGQRLAAAFEAQGVAVVQPTESGGATLLLLASGSGQPDALPVTPQQSDALRTTLDRLNAGADLFRRGIGLHAVDVLDVEGVVVARVDPGSAAAGAGIAAGDRVVTADGKPLQGAAQLQQMVDGRDPGEAIGLSVTDRSGATKPVRAVVANTPRLVGAGDTGLVNSVAIAELRASLAAATDPAEEAVARLSLGGMLLRVGEPVAARELLEGVQLPDGPGVSKGTANYLLGQACLAMGDSVAAAQAWKAAAASPAQLGPGGPPVKPLAEEALQRLPAR